MDGNANPSPMLDELKKLIKYEQKLSGGRLNSLKLPRDLTLGGTKPKPKPNLNVIRNKDKIKSINIPKINQNGFNKRQFDKTKDNLFVQQRSKRAKLLETDGVFSQGMGELRRPSYHSKHSSSPKDTDGKYIPVPKINKPVLNSNDKAKDIELINQLFEKDSESDSDGNDYSGTVMFLPAKRNSTKLKKEIKTEYEEDFDIKTSPNLNPNANTPYTMYECSLSDYSKMYDDEHPAISLVKVPDSFVGKLWKDDESDETSDCTLRDLPEGQLGTVRIRKSGKMEFVIKNNVYDFNVERTSNTSESAILFPGEESIAIEPSVVELGGIDEKFTISPEWNPLFDRANERNQFFW